jgi:methionyl aminopeptidase
MSVGGEGDRRGLREVGRVVRIVLDTMRRSLKAGVSTAELDGVAGRVLAANGARHAPRLDLDFPGDSCISVNDEAVHGVPGERVIRAGDLVKLDVVAEKDGYFADAAVTVAVLPAPDERQRLVACARAAFGRAMQVARAGMPVSAVGRAIEGEVRRRGFWVLRELCGHGVGRRIHEAPSVPNFADPGASAVLTEGLVIAVEPIISARPTRVIEGSDGWTLRTADGSLAAHYEHTLIVTRRAPVLLTTA